MDLQLIYVSRVKEKLMSLEYNTQESPVLQVEKESRLMFYGENEPVEQLIWEQQM